MEIYVVTAISCRDCGTIGLKAFSHEPTPKEKEDVAHDIGGMYCISISTTKLELDGNTVEGDR